MGCQVKSGITGGSYCFVAGTLVHTAEGIRSIEEVAPGDYVLAYNEETGETGYKQVLHLFHNTTEELTYVEVAGADTITCTPGHKFYVEGEWLSACELQPGDVLTFVDGTKTEVLSVTTEQLDVPVATYNFEVEDWHTYYVTETGVLVHNLDCPTLAGNTNVGKKSGTGSVKNWKGQEVKIPDGHIMSPRDPSFSAKPITEAGPYTSAQRDAFLAGNSAGTKLAPHHRHQIPVRDGGVIDELPGPGHPSGNQHTAGSPSRHPAKSIFNSEPGGNVLRADEITQHWIDKGNRLIEVEPGVWIDPGF